MIKYQPGKAIVVADTLSRSVRGIQDEVEQQCDSQNEEIAMMMHISIIPVEEIQKWHKALQEDLVTKKTINKIQ